MRRLYALVLLVGCDRVFLTPNEPVELDASTDAPIQPPGVAIEAVSVARSAFETSFKTAHTIGSFEGRMLVVATSQSFAGTHVTAMTYASTPLELAGVQDAMLGDGRVEIWRLASPPSGTADLEVTLTDNNSSVVAGAVSLTGAGSAGPFTSKVANTGGPSITVASAPDELVLGVVMWNGGNYSSLVPETDQQSRWNENAGGIVGAGGTAAGDAMTTMSWRVVDNFNDYWATAAISIRP